MKVLIADDSILIQERLIALIGEVKALELVGQAKDGTEAIDAIRRLGPDVVILDIRMPGANGFEVLGAIKQESAAPVVIVLTNFPYPQYRQRCLALGVEYFLDKTTGFEQIPEILKGLSAQDEAGVCSVEVEQT